MRVKRTRSPTRSGKKPSATATTISGVRPIRFHPPECVPLGSRPVCRPVNPTRPGSTRTAGRTERGPLARQLHKNYRAWPAHPDPLRTAPMPLDSLHDLFVDELKDLYNAEHQLLKALPKMAKMRPPRN